MHILLTQKLNHISSTLYLTYKIITWNPPSWLNKIKWKTCFKKKKNRKKLSFSFETNWISTGSDCRQVDQVWAHQFSLLIWSPKPGVSITVSFILTPFSSTSTERKSDSCNLGHFTFARTMYRLYIYNDRLDRKPIFHIINAICAASGGRLQNTAYRDWRTWSRLSWGSSPPRWAAQTYGSPWIWTACSSEWTSPGRFALIRKTNRRTCNI